MLTTVGFIRWRQAGVWDRMLQAVSAAYDGDIQMIDSSSVRHSFRNGRPVIQIGVRTFSSKARVHQHAANGKKGGRSSCVGRSRGGLTTKIHALVDGAGLPILLKLTEGQAHDGRSAVDMLETLSDGTILLADRAYDSNLLRETLAARRAWANVKALPHRLGPPANSPFLFRYRNLVERFFNKLKHFRAVATRCDKLPENYRAAVNLASIRTWMRFNESVT